MTQTLTALLDARYSCRGYKPDRVPRAVIEEALADAQHVPSWCNSQPWQVHACDPPQTRALAEALHEHARSAAPQSDVPFPTAYEGVYKTRRSDCGWQLYDAVGVEKGDRAGSAVQMMENFRLFGAPNFLLITTPKALGPYGVLDCGAFVTASLLALRARGVASIAMASVAGYSPFLRHWFSLAQDRDVLCGIALGFEDPDHPANQFRTRREDVATVVKWHE